MKANHTLPSVTWDTEFMLHSLPFEPFWPLLTKLHFKHFPETSDLMTLSLEQAIKTQGGAAISFIPPTSNELKSPYESRIYETGEVETRAHNWHDLFNAFVWLTFPHTKAQLNATHYRILLRTAGVSPASRGVARDMLTLFDEGGMVIACANNELQQLLINFAWKELFWQRRQEVRQQMRFYLFGHALYEKLLAPHLGLTSKAVFIKVESDFFSRPTQQQIKSLDIQLAHYFSNEATLASTQQLAPVPILGIPGWTKENEAETYYENQDYFRPGRYIKVPKNR